MNDLTNAKNLKEKLESFLAQSCEAEERGDRVEAERLFKMALYCEGLSRPEVGSAREYAQQAGCVYPDLHPQV
jgi:hypothetical protein